MIKKCIKSIIKSIKKKELIPIPKVIDERKVLDDRVALITGGSGGIGIAIAKAFINSGCRVVIAGTNENKLRNCCKELGDENSRYIVIDFLADAINYESIVDAVAASFNTNRIDILVNSAGITNEHGFFEITEAEYDRIMDVNTKGLFFLSQAVAANMLRKNIKGNILNVSSSSALRPAWTPYQMSKWAVRGFTMGLADSLLPHNIVVNAIAPGPTATKMMGIGSSDSIWLQTNPSRRFVTPEEIAQLAVFMVSDSGRMIVGDTFYMTGGSGTITYHG